MTTGTRKTEPAPERLTAALRRHAAERPEALAYLTDRADRSRRLPYGELQAEARRIAAHLRGVCADGERALLLYAAPSDFVPAFLGCLFAGCTAVLALPPDFARLQRTLPRLATVAQDADIAVVLTTASLAASCREHEVAVGAAGVRWMETDCLGSPDLAAAGAAEPSSDALAVHRIAPRPQVYQSHDLPPAAEAGEEPTTSLGDRTEWQWLLDALARLDLRGDKIHGKAR